MWNQKVHKNPPLELVLNSMNPVHTLRVCLFNIQFTIVVTRNVAENGVIINETQLN